MNSLRPLRLCSSYFLPLMDLLRVFCYLLLCVPVCSDTLADTLYCRQLQSGRSDGTVYARRWVTYEGGAYGGVEGDVKVFPVLANYRHAAYESGHDYWPPNYPSASIAPILYTVKSVHSLDINVPSNKVFEVLTILDDYGQEWAKSAVISGLSYSYNSDLGDYVLNITTYTPGRVLGYGVVTLDKDGNTVLSYPDSSGYCSGYTYGPDNTLVPCYYDPKFSSGSPPYSPELSSIRDTTQSTLTLDPDTGDYTFEFPDYSPQLSQINESILALNPFLADLTKPPTVNVDVNPNITVNPPAVTLNPEITVNPPDVNVTVDTPDYSQNLSSISSALSDLHSAVEDVQDDLESNTSVANLNTGPFVLSSDEQSLIDTVSGWSNSLPLFGSSFGNGMDFLLGKVPSVGHDLEAISEISLGPFPISVDFTSFSVPISWFRAFCLLFLIVGFVHEVWKAVVESLQV